MELQEKENTEQLLTDFIRSNHQRFLTYEQLDMIHNFIYERSNLEVMKLILLKFKTKDLLNKIKEYRITENSMYEKLKVSILNNDMRPRYNMNKQEEEIFKNLDFKIDFIYINKRLNN